MFALFKYLLWLCMPYSIVLLLLALTAICVLFRKQLRLALGLLFLDVLLVAISLPWVATSLGYSLEKKFPPTALNDIPRADAIVLLGGGVGSMRAGMPYPECYPAADRVVMAARLYHAGKASVIIPTGETSAAAEKPLLETMRVPPQAILCETEARDTAENANKTLAMLQKKNCKTVLLVTSSWHLPRATMLFQAPGIKVIPVGCDYEATLATLEAKHAPLWMKLPSLSAAAQTGVYLKEYLGILFYSFKKPKTEATATK